MDITGITKSHHAGIPKPSSKQEWKLFDSLREQIAGYIQMVCEQGFLPVAPHLLFLQFLNEGIEEKRRLGIAMGMELLTLCDEGWVFGEATEGMAAEIASATEQGKEIIFRRNVILRAGMRDIRMEAEKACLTVKPRTAFGNAGQSRRSG